MSMELKMLVWSIVLGLVQIALAATLATGQRGFAWGAGARDGTPAPITPLAARISRASANFLETFPLFAAAVLVLAATQRGDANTAIGAQMYFWARVAYVPAYASGISMVRTITWAVSITGLILVLRALF
ncbi:MAG: MAPEG family protein [Arenimonas sp.]